jgi:2-(1,2-epoxy-1,2-dihydrophenyl)acetyl-CoA isomerase
MSDVIKVERSKSGVATVTMNRPKALNALNQELTDGLRDAILSLEQDADVRAVVITGGEHFMAGGDLKWFAESLHLPAQEKRVMFEQFINVVHPIILSIRRMPKPVIASVNGACAGFGLSLMLACDLSVASDSSFYTLAYTLIGVSPDGGSTYSLARLVGMKKAMEIALLGDRFDAAAAMDYGLVNWVVPADQLGAETTKLAERLAAGPTGVYGRTKALIQNSANASLETQLQREAEAFAICATKPDFAEGITAFIEKRKASFTGE